MSCGSRRIYFELFNIGSCIWMDKLIDREKERQKKKINFISYTPFLFTLNGLKIFLFDHNFFAVMVSKYK